MSPPLVWRAGDPMLTRGTPGLSCDPTRPDESSPVPRACIPPGSPEFAALLRDSELGNAVLTVEFTEALCMLVAQSVIERRSVEGGMLASLDALAEADAVERAGLADDLRGTEELLDKVLVEVWRFEDDFAAGRARAAVGRMRTVARRLRARATVTVVESGAKGARA